MSSIDPEVPQDDEFLRDLMGEVQADWKALGEGQSMPPAELDAQDPGTRAAVSWMQDAWTSIREDVAPPMPMALARAYRSQRAPRRRRRVLWVAAGLAAIALAVAGAALLPMGSGAVPGEGTDPSSGDLIASEPVAPHRATQDGAAPTSVPPTPLDVPRAAAPIRTFTPDQFVSRPDGVEIVTGKVRIILLQADR